jgi:AraC-like DNA-binding protein
LRRLPDSSRGVVRSHVETTIGVLRDRLAEPWTLTTLAEEVHLSRSQVVRAFEATAGASPMAYLRQMRLRQMVRLLTSTGLSISEAARAVGWTDAFYASRCFHAYYGMSPTELRRQHTAPPLGRQRYHHVKPGNGQAEHGQSGAGPVWSVATTITTRALVRAWSMSAASSGRRESRSRVATTQAHRGRG